MRDRFAITLVGALTACASVSASGANEAFQDFFFRACDAPVGELAARCAETDDAEGNLSGDSESSLNPSQSLSINDGALQAAQRRGQEIRERLRSDDLADSKIEVGRLSLLLNLRSTSTDAEREVDLDATRSYELDQRAAEIGADYRIKDSLTVGGWLYWESSELDFVADLPGRNFTPAADTAGSMDTDTWGATVFLSSRMGEHVFVDASLSYGVSDVDAARNSVFQESNREITQNDVFTAANTDGDEFLATANIGYEQSFGAWSITPFAGITFIDTGTDGYAERDLNASGLAMTFNSTDQSLTVGQVGVYLNRPILMNAFVLVPQLRVEYVAELDADESRSSSFFINDSSVNRYEQIGQPTEEDRLDIALSLVGIFPGGLLPYIEYQTTQGDSRVDRDRIAAGVRYNF